MKVPTWLRTAIQNEVSDWHSACIESQLHYGPALLTHTYCARLCAWRYRKSGNCG